MILETANMQKGREIPQPVGWRRWHKIIQPRVYVYSVVLQRSGDEYWPPTTPDVFEVVCNYGRKNGTLRYKTLIKWTSYEKAVKVFYEKIEEMHEKGYDGYAMAASAN
jgi:hypothetical protein